MSLKVTLALCAVLSVGACAGPFHDGHGHGGLDAQMASPLPGPVLSVQGYVNRCDDDRTRLQTNWRPLREALQSRPGFRTARLSAPVGETKLWLLESEWDSAAALRAASTDPEVRAAAEAMPGRRFAHLFTLEQ